MTLQSSDHPNLFKDLDIPTLKIYAKKIATFVEDKIASYQESKGGPNWVTEATLYRYQYPGGLMAISRFPVNVLYCIVISIFGIDELFPKIPPHADCTVLYGLRAIIVPIDDFLKLNYSFFPDVYFSKIHFDFIETSKNNLSSKNTRNMVGEWHIVAIDCDNKEFADKCQFLNLDFPNIVIYKRNNSQHENLENLLIEAVPEVATIYNEYKKLRNVIKNDNKIKINLKMYFNDHRSAFSLVKEKFLNNDFLYSSENFNAIRRDFCGRLLSLIIEEYGYNRPGAQTLFARMRVIERANKERDLT